MRKNLPVTDQELSYSPTTNLLSMTNPKGVIKYANPEFAEVAGYTLEELQGQAHNLVRHPDMPQEAFKMMWGNLQDGKPWMGVVKNRCKNGDYYWVDAYATPIKSNGKIIELQSVRVKPEQIWVDRAESLYSQLRDGKTPFFLKGKTIPLVVKLMLGTIIAMLLGGLITTTITDTSVTSILLSVLISGAVSCGVLSWLWKPMAAVLKQAQEITSDPLAMHIYTGRNDEAGQLLLAFKMLMTETGGLVGRIADDSSRVNEKCNSLSDTAKENNQHIENMHAQTNQVATAVNEMTASIQEVANNAAQTADSAQEAKQASEKGGELVKNTSNTIAELAKEIGSASTVISQLEQDSEDINRILEVIRSVAEQTNLLALNAAIEAARAGEQGRGFAVVADEVRTLATRTHESTEEITAMIEKLQNGSQAAVKSMKEAESKAEQSVEQAKSTTDSINHVNQSIQNISDMSYQIASAVEEQSTVAEEVNKSITIVSESSEKLSLSSSANENNISEAITLCKSLHEMANEFFINKRKINGA